MLSIELFDVENNGTAFSELVLSLNSATDQDCFSLYGQYIRLYRKDGTRAYEVAKRLIKALASADKNKPSLTSLALVLNEEVDGWETLRYVFPFLSESILKIIFNSRFGRNPDELLKVIKTCGLGKAQYLPVLRYLVSETVNMSFSKAEDFIFSGGSNSAIVEGASEYANLDGGPRRQSLRGPLKVAVCVSGQFRGAANALSWLPEFLEGCEVDYFVSTWEKTGQFNEFGTVINRIWDKQLQSHIRELLSKDAPFLDEILEEANPPVKLTAQYIAKTLNKDPVRINLESEDGVTFSNHNKMYYKINDCFEMARNAGQYDLFLRVRPDLLIDTKGVKLTDLNVSKKMHLYTLYGYRYTYYGFGVDDKFAIGDENSMAIYSSLWKLFVAKAFGEEERLVGHVSLAKVLSLLRVDVTGLRGFDSFFCANDPLSKKTLLKIYSVNSQLI